MIEKRFAFLKFNVFLYSSSTYYNRFWLSRTPAKLSIETAIEGFLGKIFKLWKIVAKLFIEVPRYGWLG